LESAWLRPATKVSQLLDYHTGCLRTPKNDLRNCDRPPEPSLIHNPVSLSRQFGKGGTTPEILDVRDQPLVRSLETQRRLYSLFAGRQTNASPGTVLSFTANAFRSGCDPMAFLLGFSGMELFGTNSSFVTKSWKTAAGGTTLSDVYRPSDMKGGHSEGASLLVQNRIADDPANQRRITSATGFQWRNARCVCFLKQDGPTPTGIGRLHSGSELAAGTLYWLARGLYGYTFRSGEFHGIPVSLASSCIPMSILR